MNKPSFESAVEHFLDGSLTISHAEKLTKAMTNDAEIARSLAAQRTVDQLLRLVSEDEAQHAAFVDRCVETFSDQILITTRHEEQSSNAKRKRLRPSRLFLTASCVGLVALGAWMLTFGFQKDNDSHHSNASDPSDSSMVKPKVEQIVDKIVGNETPANHYPSGFDDSDVPVTSSKPDLNFERNSEAPQLVERKANPVVETTEVVKIIPVESESRLPFGRVISNRSAIWSDNSPENLQAGEFHLIGGSARLKFDNGVQIRLTAPAEFSLTNRDTFKTHKGNLLVEVPKRNEAFHFKLGNQEILIPRNATFFVRASSDSLWESLVTRGSIKLANITEPESHIELSKSGLNQVVVAARDDDSKLPSTLIARGKNQFLGQCYQGKDSIVLADADNFQHFLSRVVEDGSVGWDQFAETVELFNDSIENEQPLITHQRFRELLSNHVSNHIDQENGQFERDSAQRSTTNFHGSLNINGVEQHFDSLEEYNRAKLRMLEQSNFNGSSQPEIAGQLPPQRVFEVGNQKIGFSTMDVFKQSRRKMNQ